MFFQKNRIFMEHRNFSLELIFSWVKYFQLNRIFSSKILQLRTYSARTRLPPHTHFQLEKHFNLATFTAQKTLCN